MEYCQILGIRFFVGSAEEAVRRMKGGGLLVVPAAPALKQITTNSRYRQALLEADLAIPDSGLMVLVWKLLKRHPITRLSGFKYLQVLLQEPEVRRSGNAFWVMANHTSASRNLEWLRSQGIKVPADCVYTAPYYGSDIADSDLLARINAVKAPHIILTLGGGTQERLGLFLKQNLDYGPSIHCIGAAIAFLSGDQVRMPDWADKFYVGWAFRCVSNPKQYVPRYWSARRLAGLIIRYRSELPPLRP